MALGNIPVVDSMHRRSVGEAGRASAELRAQTLVLKGFNYASGR